MKRNLLIANIIMLAAFFLVTLGMRVPSLEQNSGPKARPRAVVENLEKAPLSACCEQQVDAAVAPTVSVVTRTQVYSLFTKNSSFTTTLVGNFLPSRASPGTIL